MLYKAKFKVLLLYKAIKINFILDGMETFFIKIDNSNLYQIYFYSAELNKMDHINKNCIKDFSMKFKGKFRRVHLSYCYILTLTTSTLKKCLNNLNCCYMHHIHKLISLSIYNRHDQYWQIYRKYMVAQNCIKKVIEFFFFFT